MTYRCSSCGQDAQAPYGDILIDWMALKISRHRLSTAATRAELLTLHHLIERRGQFVPLAELEIAVFGAEMRTGNAVAVHVFHLRRLLKPMSISVVSRRGQGYKLI